MTNLNNTYSEFFRIDFDAPGGYARVADVVVRQENGSLVHRAFKVMRHELGVPLIGIKRFENEIKLLAEITKDKDAPAAITRLHDTGFVQVGLSESLHELHNGERITPNFEFVSTGLELNHFIDLKNKLMQKEHSQWLPYVVVDLASFEDSLLRQIKPKTPEEQANLFRLPVEHIVVMALKLLDILDYLHNKLRVAYLDWKPEHIYWNNSRQELKLIDWNVYSPIGEKSQEIKNIREDLRMFCGAALYCSLALTDPEDPGKSIGPVPEVPKELSPTITPRYWTNKPNFYQREDVLDDQIKLLVQVGLDPKRGFNTALDFMNALRIFSAQRTDSLIKLPKEAVQYYRSARSYIGTKDFSLAIISLELAIDAAKASGMTFNDAEKLLKSVRNELSAENLRKKAKLALELHEWGYVNDLYNEAMKLDPENEALKREFVSLQRLFNSERDLHKKGKLKIFTNLFHLNSVLQSVRETINLENSTYKFVKQQFENIRIIQLSITLLAFIIFSITFGTYIKTRLFYTVPFAPTALFTDYLPTYTSTVFPFTYTPTMTVTPVTTLTVTPELAITPTIVQGYGVLAVAFFYPVKTPNGKRIEPALQGGQLFAIIGSQMSSGELWYQCTWEIDGVMNEGWILGSLIQFVSGPSPTP